MLSTPVFQVKGLVCPIMAIVNGLRTSYPFTDHFHCNPRATKQVYSIYTKSAPPMSIKISFNIFIPPKKG